MRIKTIQLVKFKRFDDLTIDLGSRPARVIALVGPNGSGKSSVFDAFEQILQDQVGANSNLEAWFFSKAWFDADNPSQRYNKHESIKLTTLDGRTSFEPKHFYVRSAYRFTPSLRVNEIRTQGDIVRDSNRPGSSIALDQRLQGNYERLLGRLISEFWKGSKTGPETRLELIGRINDRLQRVLDIRISDLGDVSAGKGQLFFEKGTSKDFPFENLSAGEKEVVNMLIDMEVKLPAFDDTVYCIDEPELHLNTAIQRRLLKELVALIPETCQLWVATHSVGFLRALQQDLRNDAQILDFSERDYFTGTQVIRPITPTRVNWKRIFGTALEDLTGLIAPEIVIYCEGRPEPSSAGSEQGLDALVYNQVFEIRHPEAQFVSSGGGGAMNKNSDLALTILSKALDSVTLLRLKDRDGKADSERTAFLEQSPANRMLTRREIENYLFDFEILSSYCAERGERIDRAAYDALVPNIQSADLRAGQTLQHLTHLCKFSGSVHEFKLTLAAHITTDTASYSDLEASIF